MLLLLGVMTRGVGQRSCQLCQFAFAGGVAVATGKAGKAGKAGQAGGVRGVGASSLFYMMILHVALVVLPS